MNIYEQRDELLQEVRDSAVMITKLRAERDAAIVAAVVAERERCAKIAERPELYGCNIADIIRAGSNGSK